MAPGTGYLTPVAGSTLTTWPQTSSKLNRIGSIASSFLSVAMDLPATSAAGTPAMLASLARCRALGIRDSYSLISADLLRLAAARG